MMERTLIQIGASVGVTLPKEYLRKKRLRIGDAIRIDPQKVSARTKMRPSETIRPEIAQTIEDVIEEYRPLLKKLADA